MSDKPTELTSTQVQKLTGLSRSKLRFWTDGRVLNIRPSVASGRQGAATLFSVGDYYMVCLAQAAALENRFTFTAIGLAIDAIARDPEWERWAVNRGEIFAKIFGDDSVSLSYSPLVKPDTRIWDSNGEPGYAGLMRAFKKDRTSTKKDRYDLPAEKLSPEELRKELRKQLDQRSEELRKLYDLPPWVEPPTPSAILVFDLRKILGEADQRLAKVLG